MAERVGFEPTALDESPVFKTGSLNHSDTSPKQLSDLFIITRRFAFVKYFFNFFQISFEDLRFVKAVTWKFFLSFQATSIYYHGFSKMSTPFFDFFQVFLLLLFSRLLILLQFTRHVTNARSCNGFAANIYPLADRIPCAAVISSGVVSLIFS